MFEKLTELLKKLGLVKAGDAGVMPTPAEPVSQTPVEPMQPARPEAMEPMTSSEPEMTEMPETMEPQA